MVTTLANADVRKGRVKILCETGPGVKLQVLFEPYFKEPNEVSDPVSHSILILHSPSQNVDRTSTRGGEEENKHARLGHRRGIAAQAGGRETGVLAIIGQIGVASIACLSVRRSR